MLCKKPYSIKGNLVACGRCMPCRINHKRLWTHRLMLESLAHEQSTFVTLTYNNEHCPKDGSLKPEHFKNFIKRLRQTLVEYSNTNGIPPIRIRFYGCGEYGEENERPHYHLAIFGIGQDFRNFVDKAWGYGHTMSAEFNTHTAQYICGYVTKKMTKKDDPRLKGRYPEFARMSRNNGIGTNIIPILTERFKNEFIQEDIKTTGDIPRVLMHGGRKFPLGRFLSQKLRKSLDISFIDPNTGEVKYDTPRQVLDNYKQELQAMFRDTLMDTKAKQEEKLSPSHMLAVKNKGKVLSIETKQKIYNKRNTI